MSPNAGKEGLRGSQLMSTEAEFWDEIQTKVLKFSSLLFTVTSTALPWDFYFFKLTPIPPSLWFKKIHTETSRLKTLKIMPRNLNKLWVHEFGFSCARTWSRNKLWNLTSYLTYAFPCKLCRAQNFRHIILYNLRGHGSSDLVFSIYVVCYICS